MIKRNKKLCPYCDPYPEGRFHISEKLNSFLPDIDTLINRLIKKSIKLENFLSKTVPTMLIKSLSLTGIIKEVEISDKKNFYNRSLVIAREAKKRGLKVMGLYLLGNPINYFSIEFNGIKKYFEGLPHLIVGKKISTSFDNKGTFKKMMEDNALPHPRGRVLNSFQKALDYIKNDIGFPVVIKPHNGSLSKHVTCNIKDEDSLKQAINIVKKISSHFIVEEFKEGKVYRVTIVDGTISASCFREAPNITGNGKLTVEELIKEKNKEPLRGKINEKDCTLYEIPVNANVISFLADQDLNLKSILPKGKKIYLSNKVVLAYGADIHDVTDNVHPENDALFKKIYDLCKSPVIGVDFIANDVSVPYHEQNFAILEANSLPFIDMHHFPVTGKTRNVAAAIIDWYMSNNN